MQHSENLRPQDVVVACKVFSLGAARVDCTYALLGQQLGMSTSTAHESAARCRQSQLLSPSGWTVNSRHLAELLASAVPRIFYAVRGGLTCGSVTSTRAPALAGKFRDQPGGVPFVWREDCSPGDLPRGESLDPLYPTAPAACRADPILYELLALADVMRVGTAADRSVAESLIERRLSIR